MNIELTTSPEIKCSICLDPEIDDNLLCSTECSHQFCKSCLDKWFDRGKISCPMCREDIKYFNYQGNNNRIIKVSSNNINNDIINIYQIRLLFYRRILFLFIMMSLYLFYDRFNYLDQIDYYNIKNQKCLANLTTIQESNEILINENNKYKNLIPIHILMNNNIYDCVFPKYYLDLCIINL